MKTSTLRTSITKLYLYTGRFDQLSVRRIAPPVYMDKSNPGNLKVKGFQNSTAARAVIQDAATAHRREPSELQPAIAPNTGVLRKVRSVLSKLFSGIEIIGQRDSDRLIREQYRKAFDEAGLPQFDLHETLAEQCEIEEQQRIERFKSSGL